MKNIYYKYAQEIFNIHSPSGYTKNVILRIKELLADLGFESEITNKGNLKVEVAGLDNKVVATSAHVDTLGLMVRSITGNGELKVTNLGGPLIPSLDGEYCVVKTRKCAEFSGTILSTSPSVHVFKDAASKPRDLDNIVIRLDEEVSSKKDVENLGIQNGDYIFIDPKFVITPNDFIKSRFIDDKGSVCCLLTILEKISKKEIQLAHKTIFYFVVHEEVGHGAATVDERIEEFVTVDMGCVGLDLAGSEYKVSIAAKDSGGPYDYELTTKLLNLANENNVDYVVDIFPFYGSDIGAAWRSGKDLKGALIGPGVAASHGMERTHYKAIENTIKLLVAYLTN